MKKNILASCFLVVASFVISIAMVEIVLRLKGFHPNKEIVNKHEPTMLSYDSILGWKNKEGIYTYPGYDASVKEVKVTILKGGFRKTSIDQGNVRSEKPKILFLGGSFTHGQAISDEETFAWKLQTMFPKYEVLNVGIPAYGTYQSLLMLEKQLLVLDQVKLVIYGSIDHHLERNVAPSSWRNALVSFSTRNHVDIPYISYENSIVKRNPPEGYQKIFGSTWFSSLRLIERNLVNYRKNLNPVEKTDILSALLYEMIQITKEKGIEFAVMNLGMNPGYGKILIDSGAPMIDCVIDEETNDLIVKGEGHPNGEMNNIWAECLADYLSVLDGGTGK